MKKLVFLAVLALLAGNAFADQFCEGFPDPLEGWKTRDLGVNTDLCNYYVCYGGSPESYRGNNPCGLWISDHDGNQNNAVINVLVPSWGATVTNLTMDIVPFVPEIFNIIDASGHTAFTLSLPADGTFPPCDNNVYGGPTTGLLRWEINANGGGQVEGNTGIDNVCLDYGNPVPTKTTSWGQIKASYK